MMALDLPPGKLSPAMQAYFKKCQEKLGFVPNVLTAYAFDNAKLEAFVDYLQRPDAGAVRPLQARARDDRGRGVVAEPLLLLPHRAWRGGAQLGDPVLGEMMVMNYRAARLDQEAARDARFRREDDRRSPGRSRRRTASALRRVGFSDRDIWDIAAVAGFFNMSNRVASATDMRPNAVYHGQGR